MLKLIGAITCGVGAACAAAYFALRPAERRAQDVEQTKKVVKNTVNSTKDYVTSLFSAKPNVPEANA